MNCIKCGYELEQINPGIDTLLENGDDPEDNFVCIGYKCNNSTCEHFDKEQQHFYDFSRIEIGGVVVEESRIIKAGCEAIKNKPDNKVIVKLADSGDMFGVAKHVVKTFVDGRIISSTRCNRIQTIGGGGSIETYMGDIPEALIFYDELKDERNVEEKS